MLKLVASKKTRKVGLSIEVLENRNLLTALPAHAIGSSLIHTVHKPIIETAPRLNHTSVVKRHDNVVTTAAVKIGGLDSKLKSSRCAGVDQKRCSSCRAGDSAAHVRHRDSSFLRGLTWERIRRDQRFCATDQSHGAGTVS